MTTNFEKQKKNKKIKKHNSGEISKKKRCYTKITKKIII